MKLYFEQLDEDASGQLHPVPQDYKIQALKTFKRDAKRLQLTKEDFIELEQELLNSSGILLDIIRARKKQG